MGVRVPPPTQTPTNKRRLSRRISGSDFSAIGAGPSAHRFHGHIWPLNREDAVLILPTLVHQLGGHDQSKVVASLLAWVTDSKIGEWAGRR
jgi:hypothetical protein